LRSRNDNAEENRRHGGKFCNQHPNETTNETYYHTFGAWSKPDDTSRVPWYKSTPGGSASGCGPALASAASAAENISGGEEETSDGASASHTPSSWYMYSESSLSSVSEMSHSCCRARGRHGASDAYAMHMQAMPMPMPYMCKRCLCHTYASDAYVI
jgi:hypothetical protein